MQNHVQRQVCDGGTPFPLSLTITNNGCCSCSVGSLLNFPRSSSPPQPSPAQIIKQILFLDINGGGGGGGTKRACIIGPHLVNGTQRKIGGMRNPP
jgi:hypothetical protein